MLFILLCYSDNDFGILQNDAYSRRHVFFSPVRSIFIDSVKYEFKSIAFDSIAMKISAAT